MRFQIRSSYILSFSFQELFLKQVEKTSTETERERNRVAVGWYSKDDMKTQLKWHAKLDSTLAPIP